MNPIIFFGPPKTSSTFLYHAFTAFPNYQQVGTKEWHYLLPLENIGPHTYTDRFVKFHKSFYFESLWKNIYKAYINHLEHFLHYPSSDYCFAQIEHAQKLIFSDHSMENYVKIFYQDKKRFIVDLSPSNCFISEKFLSALVKMAPGTIFLVPFRPFLPLLVSKIHESFVRFSKNKTNIMETAIYDKKIESEELKRFGRLIVKVLNLLEKKFNNKNELENQKWINENVLAEKNSLIEKVNKKNADSDDEKYYIENLASKFFLGTNYFSIIRKLIPYQGRTINYYAPNISRCLLCFENQFKKLDICVGEIDEKKIPNKIRESSSVVVNALLESEALRNALFSVYLSAKKYYQNNLESSIYQIIFPKNFLIDGSKKISLVSLREIEYRPDLAIVDLYK